MLTGLTTIKKKKRAWSLLLQEVRDGSETNGEETHRIWDNLSIRIIIVDITYWIKKESMSL